MRGVASARLARGARTAIVCVFAVALAATDALATDEAPGRRGTLALAAVREGHELEQRGRLAEACASFQRAVDLLPGWWISGYERARCGRAIGDPYELLVPIANAAARAAPSSGVVWELLGGIHEDAGRPRAARDAYLRAVRLDPGLPVARRRLAFLALDAGALDEARTRFDKILARWPTDIQALNGLVETALLQKDDAAAERALLESAQRSNFSSIAYARLVKFYRARGLSASARAAERAWRRAAAGRTPRPLKPHIRP